MMVFNRERDVSIAFLYSYLKYSRIYLKTPSVVAMACSCNTVNEYFSNLGFLASIIQRSDSAIQQINN